MSKPEQTEVDQTPEVGHGHHSLLMIACCIPMLAIAVVLVATRVVGAGFIFVAVACTAMMVMMMRGMPSSDHKDSR